MKELLVAYGRRVYIQTWHLARLAKQHNCYAPYLADFATPEQLQAMQRYKESTEAAQQAVLNYHHNQLL